MLCHHRPDPSDNGRMQRYRGRRPRSTARPPERTDQRITAGRYSHGLVIFFKQNHPMKRTTFALSTLLLASVTYAHSGEPQPFPAKLTDSNVLLKDTSKTMAMHDCQPLKGDRVTVMNTFKSQAFAGAEIARVRVETGRCQGQVGDVGTQRLEAAQ